MTAQIHHLHPELALIKPEDMQETKSVFADRLGTFLVVAGFCIIAGTLVFCWGVAKAVGVHDGRLDKVCEARR